MNYFLTIIGILYLFVNANNLYSRDINTDVLSEIISKKQDELKKRVLSDIVVKHFIPENDNYTYNTLYNLVNIITKEKNKSILLRSTLKKITEYTLVMKLHDVFIQDFLKNKLNLDNDFVYHLRNFNDFNKNVNKNNTFLGWKVGRTDRREKNKSYVSDDFNFNLNAQLEDVAISTLNEFYKNNFKLIFDLSIDLFYNEIKKHEIIFKNGILDTNYRNTLMMINNFELDFLKDANDSQKEVYYKIIKHLKENIIDFVNNKMVSKVNTSDIIFYNNLIAKKMFNISDIINFPADNLKWILKYFKQVLNQYPNKGGSNGIIYNISDLIIKYIVFENDEDKKTKYYLDIDAIILTLEEKYFKDNKIKIIDIQECYFGLNMFFTIGINHSSTIKNVQDELNLPSFTFAGEKFGLKVIFFDLKHTRSFEPMEWFKYKGDYWRWHEPVSKNIINNCYYFSYFSGIIYNLVELNTNKNMEYYLWGNGIGVEIYNGLEFNFSYAIPIISTNSFKEMNNNAFLNIGFDIPIFEYISELNK